MIPNYEKEVIEFVSPAEEAEYKAHMAEYGPATGKSHPDDCPYCAARGWNTFPGTSFKEECAKRKAQQ
ncbi:hypothetical protein SAMN05443270_3033 [Lacrimispora sphenoides]|uniref:hypothetical protein n=1 Tax=Lacrimispora sphenoides TaxID=29370 RepID=UPI0008C8BD8B|nr:hypothetical protein [Lacrimispora sphenoides]SEU08608.1 hypothetical protein SAMN05443270_3033 [Lacrimispora sphenoides]